MARKNKVHLISVWWGTPRCGVINGAVTGNDKEVNCGRCLVFVRRRIKNIKQMVRKHMGPY